MLRAIYPGSFDPVTSVSYTHLDVYKRQKEWKRQKNLPVPNCRDCMRKL